MTDLLKKTSLLWMCLLLLSPTQVLAGAWTQEKGHFYAKLMGSRFQAEEFFDDSGTKVPIGNYDDLFEDLSTSFYMEYGLLDRLTVVFSLPAKRLTAENRFLIRETEGIGDVNLGAKYLLKGGGLVLSLMGNAKIPTGYEKTSESLLSAPPLGGGQVDIETKFLAGTSFYPIPAYVSGEAGFRLRTEAFGNELTYAFEFGYMVAGRILLKGAITGIKSLASDKDQEEFDVLDIVDQDFLKLGPDIIFKISDNLEFDVLYERTISGKNTGVGTIYGVGLAYTY